MLKKQKWSKDPPFGYFPPGACKGFLWHPVSLSCLPLFQPGVRCTSSGRIPPQASPCPPPVESWHPWGEPFTKRVRSQWKVTQLLLSQVGSSEGTLSASQRSWQNETLWSAVVVPVYMPILTFSISLDHLLNKQHAPKPLSQALLLGKHKTVK